MKIRKNTNDFLAVSKADMQRQGFDQADVILVTADAYVDHPSFGAALIGRWLQSNGFNVAILSQPDWRSVEPFRELGEPKLFWGITGGAVDSRLNNYASMRHKRKTDVYSPGGKTGMRPDKPLLTYAARAREAYKGVPVVLGGLEASLRRLSHYDYIEDKLKQSVLTDAKADMLVHGMGELAVLEIAKRLAGGESIDDLTDIAGTAYAVIRQRKIPDGIVELPGIEEMQKKPKSFMTAQKEYQRQSDPQGRAVLQKQIGGDIVVLPPARPLRTDEIDKLYDLPFTRTSHPKYKKVGAIPALESIQFSITTHRGCFGGCSFCSIYFHQGKQICSRSAESILYEAEQLKAHPDFKGTITDIGGPTANMYGINCTGSGCQRQSCLFPNVCPKLGIDYSDQLQMLNKVARWKKTNSVNCFIASGVRHDLAMYSKKYIELLAKEFVGGHLKVAPEHYCPEILKKMGKPEFGIFEKFEGEFARASQKAGKEQYLVPYFITSHPGCGLDEAITLSEYLIKRNWRVRQVQDFTPVPLSLSAAMHYSGVDENGKKIHIPKGNQEKRLQAALLQYFLGPNLKYISQQLGQNPRIRKLLSKMRQLQLNTPKSRQKKM